MSDFFVGLNPQQKAAVEKTEGPLLVIAGAGSGKTRVITTRIMHLLQNGVAPYRILAMTFTNKAAREMKARIMSQSNSGLKDLTITTFHSFCALFLRREIAYLDREPSFAIFDSQDQLTCLKQVIKASHLGEKNFPANAARNYFSFLKNKWGMEAINKCRDQERDLFAGYLQALKDQNALDFDDLLIFACHILEQSDEVRQRYRTRFSHILVDEYQDTNQTQLKLLKLLLNDEANICAVGDEDQSIYGWRGADIRNILEFDEHFPGTTLIKLEQNYRSTQSILDFANRVIEKNESRKPKSLWSDGDQGKPVAIKVLPTGSNEAEYIVQDIMLKKKRHRCRYNDFAILFRSNFLSRSLEEMFRRYQIPYQLIGGLKFYDRKEIKDLLAYMRIVVNPHDWTSFFRALNTPARGMGAKAVEQLEALFRQGLSIPAVLETAIKEKALHSRAMKGFKQFKGLHDFLVQGAKDKRPSVWISELIEKLDYEAYLEKHDEFSVDSRIENIKELLVAIQEMEKAGMQTLAEFMDYSSLVSDQDDLDENADRVNLMTIHASKGLEFDSVYVVGLEEGIFPSQRAVDSNPGGLEEERRLFYVAITRAKQELCLTRASRRQTYGNFMANRASIFLIQALKDTYRGIDITPVGRPAAPSGFSVKKEASRLLNQLDRIKNGN